MLASQQHAQRFNMLKTTLAFQYEKIKKIFINERPIIIEMEKAKHVKTGNFHHIFDYLKFIYLFTI